jgi:hypothetical protein
MNCTRNSFAAGTLILLADGTTKPIEDLTIGDKVTATDPFNGQTEAEPVTMLHLNRDSNLVDITVDVEPAEASGNPSGEGNGDRSTRGPTQATIHTTAEHPFWNAATRQWTNAADLQPGQSLLSADGTTYEVTAVTPVAGAQNMRNLTVANLHTYYVLAGTTPVLVHNTELVPGQSCPITVRPGFTPKPGRGGAPGSREGQDFTVAGKDEVLQRNALGQPDGVARCANPQCQVELLPATRSTSGVTPNPREAQVDHIDAKANGGSGDPSNGQGLCRLCNGAKSSGPQPW